MFESLLLAKSPDELYGTAATISAQLGFKHLLHGSRFATSIGKASIFTLSGHPEAWRIHYQAHNYERIDPLLIHCARRVVPVTWDDQLFVKPEAVKLYCEAKEHGLVGGVSFPIHAPGVDVSMLSLVSDRELSHSKIDLAGVYATGQLFACYLHEATQNLKRNEENPAAPTQTLTAREKECLLWAAVGKTSWEIARILSISERTTVFHFVNAAEKLGAVNRRQAVVRAIALGLINP